MEKKKTKKKWREIRSAITMMCVMVAMLSTATYAWFTFAQNATVTGLEMTAKTSGGLLVSSDRINWTSAVDLRTGNDDISVLTPVSVVHDDVTSLNDGSKNFYSPKFLMPIYNGGYEVTGLYNTDGKVLGNDSSDVSENELDKLTGLKENIGTKAVKKTFYIKEGSNAETTVGIEIADVDEVVEALTAQNPTTVGVAATGKPNIEGSFVVLNPKTGSYYTNADNAADDALEAVRIGLVIWAEDEQSATLKVWEPNSDMTVLGSATFATNNVDGQYSAVTPAVQSKYDGSITIGGNGNTSDALFTLENDTNGDGVRVDVFMWFEGQDPSCVNEIMADTVIAQLKFVAVQ